MSEDNIPYVLFVRVPRPRGDFVDPPNYLWDSQKDDELWDHLVANGKGNNIKWGELAEKFEVSTAFLLRQANFLAEHHASRMKAQFRLANIELRNSPQSTNAIPTSDSTTRLAAKRNPSLISIREYQREDQQQSQSQPQTKPQPTLIPAPSPFHDTGSAYLPRPASARIISAGYPPPRSDTESTTRKVSGETSGYMPPESGAYDDNQYNNAYAGPPSDSDSDHSDSSSTSSPAQSRIIRRPPNYIQGQFADDDEDDSEPAFLNEQESEEQSSDTSALSQGMNSTLRGEVKRKLPVHKHRHHPSQTSDSSANSSFVTRMPGGSAEGSTTRLDGRKHRKEVQGSSKYSNISTKSSDISSSFSDLDGEFSSNNPSMSAMADAVNAHPGFSKMTFGSSISRFVGGNGRR